MRSLDLDIPLSVTPAMVSPTRRLLESQLVDALDDEDAAYRVAMTAHELLENAAKYASDGRARLRVAVSRQGAPGEASVRVAVTNSTSAAHVAELRAAVAEMASFDDPMAHYFVLMRRNASSGTVSRLGLARLRAEGEMQVSVDIAGNQVTIVATTVVPAAPRP